MAAKRLLLGTPGRTLLLEGSRVLASAVKPTLGPGGRNVFIERPGFRSPLITKDGVTVAENVALADPFANMGSQLLLEGTMRTGAQAGDGTTTATVLAHAIYREGVKLVTAGHHPLELKRGIDLAVERVVAALAKQAKPMTGKRDIKRIALISANGDEGIAGNVAEAIGKVGLEGILHVERGTALETRVEVSDGMEYDRGFLSAYFITDKVRLLAELEDPYVLLCAHKVTDVNDLIPILEKVKKAERALLLVAEVQGDALSLLVVNQLQGTMKLCAIMPPYYGESRAVALGDMAAQTSATVLGEEPGIKLRDAQLAALGRAKRVVVDQSKSVIIGGHANRGLIEARSRDIRESYDQTNSTLRHELLRERLRRLVGGAALIRVGGTTEAEARERTHRTEDAAFATRAAIQEGIVAGGGVALIRAAAGLERLKRGVGEERAAGIAIVARACEEPARQIADNAGADASEVLGRIRRGKGGFGYNAAKERFEDLLRAGVIDPAMVVRLALQHAASVATLLLTSEALIVDAPREVVEHPISGSSEEGMSMEPYLSRRRPKG